MKGKIGIISKPQHVAKQSVQMYIFAFNDAELFETSSGDIQTITTALKKYPITWVKICGLGDLELLSQLARLFSLNTLAMEDVVHVHQRPKVEEYNDILFAVANEPDIINKQLYLQQISIFCGANFILTFQEHESDCFEPLLIRIKHGNRQRFLRADYLLYSILDAIVDNFFPILENYGTQLDDIEELAIDNSSSSVIRHIHHFKHDLHVLRRAAWAQREAMIGFREIVITSNEEIRFYIRDCEDHTIQIIDIIESYRERTSGLMDVYLASVNNRTNNIVKVLTITMEIFMPISVLAGIYGMNFDRSKPWNMPELSWEYGYAYFWAMAVTIIGIMLLTFKRKGWFKR